MLSRWQGYASSLEYLCVITPRVLSVPPSKTLIDRRLISASPSRLLIVARSLCAALKVPRQPGRVPGVRVVRLGAALEALFQASSIVVILLA